MAKDPAVLFYTSDFLTGCALMSMAQRGKYITLLCLQHQQGHLSEEDMIVICGEYDEKIFSKFEQDENGLYYNKRMDDEAEKRRKFVESRQNNLKSTGKSKSHMETHTDSHMENDMDTHTGIHTDNHMEKHMENENENIDKSIFPFSSIHIKERVSNEQSELDTSSDKDKKTEKINIIKAIFEHWNSKKIICHKELSEVIRTAVENALKSYNAPQIMVCIDRYAKAIGDSTYFFDYKWTLTEFLTRKDGISSFTDEGSKWVNYLEHLTKEQRSKSNVNLGLQPRSFDPDKFLAANMARTKKILEDVKK